LRLQIPPRFSPRSIVLACIARLNREPGGLDVADEVVETVVVHVFLR